MTLALRSLTGGEDERFERCRGNDCALFAASPEELPIDVSTLEELLEERVLRAPSDVRVMRDGRAMDIAAFAHKPRVSHPSLEAGLEAVVHPPAVLELFDAGATVVFQGLQNHVRELGMHCAALSGELGARVGANAYLSPPRSRGARHFDHHDVFMVQLRGEKRWMVERPEAGPEIDLDRNVGADDRPAPPALDTTLRPGDALYLPRGFWHECATGREASLHLTLSVHASACADVVREAIESFVHEAPYARTLRSGPRGNDDATALLRRASIDFDTHLRRLLAAGPGGKVDAGRATGYANLEHRLTPYVMHASSRLVPIDAPAWHEERDGDALRVRVGALRVTLPTAMGAAVSILRAGKPVRVGELVKDQSESVLLALSRELLRAGLVHLEADP